jgi:AraC family transcriptional regulator
MESSNSREHYRSRIDQSVAYINENLGGDLDLAQVAGASHFSSYHFHRIFTAALGETPQDFVNRLRLERAANLLWKSPSLSITQVAFSCGFSSSSTFARSFKKHFGITASEYGKSAAAGALLPSSPTPVPELQIGTFFSKEIQVKKMPGLHLAYIANYHGYDLEKICQAWARLSRWAAAHNLFTPATQMIGISFDDPLITARDKCRYYACITAPPELKTDRVVGFMELPAGPCIVYRVECSAEQIESIYRYLYACWLPDSGLEPADFPCYEIYYQTPETHPDYKYDMDICIPVTPF